MKIELPDELVNRVMEFFGDFIDAIVLAWMERQLRDEYEYTHPDDIKYYKKHRKYARHFIEYLSVPDGRD